MVDYPRPHLYLSDVPLLLFPKNCCKKSLQEQRKNITASYRNRTRAALFASPLSTRLYTKCFLSVLFRVLFFSLSKHEFEQRTLTNTYIKTLDHYLCSCKLFAL